MTFLFVSDFSCFYNKQHTQIFPGGRVKAILFPLHHRKITAAALLHECENISDIYTKYFDKQLVTVAASAVGCPNKIHLALRKW